MGVLKTIFAVFLVVNALFWGLGPHSSHCGLAASLGMTTCVPHMYHVMFGVLCFIVTVIVVQWRKV